MTARTLPLPLETERLILRPPDPAIAEEIQQAIDESFADLHEWMPWAKDHQTLDGTREFLQRAKERFARGEEFAVSAFHRVTGAYVLGTGLHPRNWDVPKFEIGYWCRSSQQGRGFTTEAVRALAALAFERMEARRVEIRCDSRNRRSRRVAERAGFELEATLKADDRANDGSLRDTLIFVRLRPPEA
jgi:RimJ/RimL family protein N-acetyltransferase